MFSIAYVLLRYFLHYLRPVRTLFRKWFRPCVHVFLLSCKEKEECHYFIWCIWKCLAIANILEPTPDNGRSMRIDFLVLFHRIDVMTYSILVWHHICRCIGLNLPNGIIWRTIFNVWWDLSLIWNFKHQMPLQRIIVSVTIFLRSKLIKSSISWKCAIITFRLQKIQKNSNFFFLTLFSWFISVRSHISMKLVSFAEASYDKYEQINYGYRNAFFSSRFELTRCSSGAQHALMQRFLIAWNGSNIVEPYFS